MGDKLFGRLGSAMDRLGKRMSKAGEDLSRDADGLLREADELLKGAAQTVSEHRNGMFTTTTKVEKTVFREGPARKPDPAKSSKERPTQPPVAPKPDKIFMLVANERPVQGFWTLKEAEAAVRELQDLFAGVTKEGGESWKTICEKYPTTFFLNAPYFAQIGFVTVKVK